jgi:hypothetical protein
MNTRLLEFDVGIETSSQPDPSAATTTGDLITGSMLRSKYAVALADGDASKAITFAKDLGTASYAVFAKVKNLTLGNDNAQAFYDCKTVVQTSTGFTVRFSGPIVGSNETLDWYIIVGFDPAT